ncbi:MAG: Trp family transcriptional regulator [Kiritimatiellae bacterium]|nr:Trp family transcriptional regulator [Kiritimatiellia bacterium]
MTSRNPTSRRQTDNQPTSEDDSRRELAAVFARVRDPSGMHRLLEEMLTEAELHDLSLRWRLVKLLQAGVPQREIAERLGVSLCKITRGSRVLKRPGSVLATLLPHKHAADGM